METNRKTVFLFISNFVYSSDFLRTEYIKYLSSKYRVVIFMPESAFVTDNKPYYKNDNIIYISWQLQFPKFWNFFGKYLRYSLIRKYDFEPVIQRNQEQGFKDWRRKILRFFSYIAPASFWTNDLFTKLELIFIPKSKKFGEIVQKYNPGVVLTATPGFSHGDAEAIILAKKSGLKTAATNFSWDNLHNGGMHFRRPDYMIVWNKRIEKTLITEYKYSPEKVFVSGIMRFDLYKTNIPNEKNRDQFLLSKDLDPKEKTILITTVTKGNYPDENILLGELLKAREEGAFPGFPNIFVRMHPKEEFHKYKPYLDNKTKNLHVEYPGKMLSKEMGTRIEIHEEDLENLKYTLKYCDVAVNYLSTMTLEAFVFDKPVVNINYPEKYHRGYTFRHYKPIIDANAVFLSKSFNDLVRDINTCLDNPEIKREERKNVFNDFIYYKDGLSYKRNVDFLEKII
jgi:hypothetical protein